ncbi:MAG: carboxypeptidase-like regulatory domain-containing protein [Gemmatimonadota bacterium]
MALVLCVAGTGPLAAQIRGRVVDDAGAPLADVLVEAWSASDRLATTRSDGEGRFAFTRPIAERARSLYLYRLGYQAMRPEVESGLTERTYRMRADPVVLDGIVVGVEEPVCRVEEDHEARALWEAATDRYDRGIADLGIATYLASAIAAVPISELGPLDVEHPGTQQRGSAPLFRASWARRVERTGYARRLSAASPDGMYVAWGYPPLEADFATHFVDPVFGKLHRFSVEEQTADGWLLRFCPKDEDRPSIRGLLKVSAADTTLTWAEWTFRTEPPEEGAGGRVVFANAGPEARPWPLPAEGMFWRRLEGSTYKERYQRYEGWLVSPGDSVPFLPVRDSIRATR